MLSDDIKAEQAALNAEMDSYRARGLLVPMELWRRVGDVQVRLAQALRAERSPAAPDEGPTYRYRVSFDCTEPTWRRIRECLSGLPTANRGFTFEAVPGAESIPFSAAQGEVSRGFGGEAGPSSGGTRSDSAEKLLKEAG